MTRLQHLRHLLLLHSWEISDKEISLIATRNAFKRHKKVRKFLCRFSSMHCILARSAKSHRVRDGMLLISYIYKKRNFNLVEFKRAFKVTFSSFISEMSPSDSDIRREGQHPIAWQRVVNETTEWFNLFPITTLLTVILFDFKRCPYYIISSWIQSELKRGTVATDLIVAIHGSKFNNLSWRLIFGHNWTVILCEFGRVVIHILHNYN